MSPKLAEREWEQVPDLVFNDNDNDDNDNDNENNFIVMNYIGTMTAVKLNIASRHLDIAYEYWHSILKFMTKGAWSLGL